MVGGGNEEGENHRAGIRGPPSPPFLSSSLLLILRCAMGSLLACLSSLWQATKWAKEKKEKKRGTVEEARMNRRTLPNPSLLPRNRRKESIERPTNSSFPSFLFFFCCGSRTESGKKTLWSSIHGPKSHRQEKLFLFMKTSIPPFCRFHASPPPLLACLLLSEQAQHL